MIRTALLITALCLSISSAMNIEFLLKKGINQSNDPPYNGNFDVLGLPDNITLLDAMKTARSMGILR